MRKSRCTRILLMLLLGAVAVVTPVAAEGGPPGDAAVPASVVGATPGPISPIVPAPPATPVVSLSARLYADEAMTQLFASIVDGRVYLGCEACGSAALYFDGANIYWGGNRNGEVLFCVHGKRVIPGRGTGGSVAYTVSGRHVYEGRAGDALLFTIDGDRLLMGDGGTDQLILRADRRLEDSAVRFLLPVLLELWSH